MLLNLKKVFLNEDELLQFEYEFSLASTDINGVFPFTSPVAAKGTIKHFAGAAKMEAEVSFDFSITCDRCQTQIDSRYRFRFEHLLVSELNDEDNDDLIEVENQQVDLDELLRADILLELPTKYLCKPDCKGLCPKCGKNRNSESCDCNLHQIDPRLEVLKKLIDHS